MKEKNQNENIKNQIENNKYTLDLINRWIEHSDNKIYISCTLFSVVFVVIQFFSKGLSPELAQNANSCWGLLYIYYSSFIFSIIFFLSSLLFYFIAIFPNFFGKSNYTEKRYSIFYENIKSFQSENAYYSCAINATDEDFNKELIEEIYYNSVICSKKMSYCRKGQISSLLSICLSIIVLLINFLVKALI